MVTAPNAKIAQSYERQIFRAQKEKLLTTTANVIVVHDPDGVRIGSGGGTLNALHQLVNCYGLSDLTSSKVLIVHSGGDSRRAPLQSILGKAWTPLKSRRYDVPASPFILLLDELSRLAIHVRPGSISVCCADVLLKIGTVAFGLNSA